MTIQEKVRALLEARKMEKGGRAAMEAAGRRFTAAIAAMEPVEMLAEVRSWKHGRDQAKAATFQLSRGNTGNGWEETEAEAEAERDSALAQMADNVRAVCMEFEDAEKAYDVATHAHAVVNRLEDDIVETCRKGARANGGRDIPAIRGLLDQLGLLSRLNTSWYHDQEILGIPHGEISDADDASGYGRHVAE